MFRLNNNTQNRSIKLRTWSYRLETTAMPCMEKYSQHTALWFGSTFSVIYCLFTSMMKCYIYFTAHRHWPGDLFSYLGHGFFESLRIQTKWEQNTQLVFTLCIFINPYTFSSGTVLPTCCAVINLPGIISLFSFSRSSTDLPCKKLMSVVLADGDFNTFWMVYECHKIDISAYECH